MDTIAVPYLTEIIAFLLAVVIIVPLFQRLRISPILGYLAVGAIIGPHSLGIVKDAESIQHLAELGVIFLLFTIGLELSFERLKIYATLIFGLGAAQVITSAVAIGGLAYLWGNSGEASLIIGLCLALSSTAMVMQLLNERGELATRHGRASFSVLLFQDLAVVPILILVTLLGSEQSDSIFYSVLLALAKATIAITLILLLGRFGLRKLFSVAAKSQSIDVFTAMTLLSILAMSVITGVAGLSMALGAFLAGLLLAETEFRHQIEAEIAPVKGLFLGLFFMSVGMHIDFGVAFERGAWVLASVIGLIVIKALITFACALAFGVKLNDAIRTGLLLAEGGEFAFLVLGQATLVYGIISPDIGQFMTVVAGLSMMLSPGLAQLGAWLASLRSKPDELNNEGLIDDDIHDHVVIIGYGRVGLTIAQILKSQSIPFIAIDNNAESVRKKRQQGDPVYVGDANRYEVLKLTGLERAATLVITMNSPENALQTLHLARRQNPDLKVVVRARDRKHAQTLLDAGADYVVPETLEASLQLSNYVLRARGLSQTEAGMCVELARRDLTQDTRAC